MNVFDFISFIGLSIDDIIRVITDTYIVPLDLEEEVSYKETDEEFFLYGISYDYTGIYGTEYRLLLRPKLNYRNIYEEQILKRHPLNKNSFCFIIDSKDQIYGAIIKNDRYYGRKLKHNKKNIFRIYNKLYECSSGDFFHPFFEHKLHDNYFEIMSLIRLYCFLDIINDVSYQRTFLNMNKKETETYLLKCINYWLPNIRNQFKS